MNIYYFWFAPTLTYQISFPRNKKIRWLRVLGYLLQIIAATTLLILLVTQTIFPHLDKMVKSLENGTLSKGSFAEMPLNLAIAGTYTWLTFFYLYFHLFLNLCAELLRFGDRVFYKDWWNACKWTTVWSCAFCLRAHFHCVVFLHDETQRMWARTGDYGMFRFIIGWSDTFTFLVSERDFQNTWQWLRYFSYLPFCTNLL